MACLFPQLSFWSQNLVPLQPFSTLISSASNQAKVPCCRVHRDLGVHGVWLGHSKDGSVEASTMGGPLVNLPLCFGSRASSLGPFFLLLVYLTP